MRLFINGHGKRREFASKEALKRFIRAIVAKYADHAQLNAEDFEFVSDLLERHRWRDEKAGVGVKSIEVRTNQPYNNRGFWIKRLDRSETDFSWVECVDHPSNRQDVLAAMRLAISEQIADFRDAQFRLFAKNYCPITGELLEPRTCHVDHVPPATFKALVDAFLKEWEVDIERVEVGGYRDGATSQSLTDEIFKRDWQGWHQRHANLRLLSASANLSQGCRLPSVVGCEP